MEDDPRGEIPAMWPERGEADEDTVFRGDGLAHACPLTLEPENILPSFRRIHIGIFGNTSHAQEKRNRIPERRNSPSRSRIPDTVNPRAVTDIQRKEITDLIYAVYTTTSRRFEAKG
jgi:hypothetical protein